MINVFTKQLKYTRRIILVTNGTAEVDTDGLDGIAEKLKSDNMELIVLYVLVTHKVAKLTCPAALISTTQNTASRKRTRILARLDSSQRDQVLL